MQVRAVEFQENFRLVTLEASRQQSIVNREAAEAGHSGSSTLAQQRALDMERAVPTTEPKQDRPISDQEEDQGPESRRRRASQWERNSDESKSDRPESGGAGIDLLV